jgi:uncharacterized protein YggE
MKNELLQTMGAVALGAFALLSLAGVWYMYKSYSKTDVRTFAVQGSGEVMVVPTKGTVNATFKQEGKTQKEANDLLAKNLQDAYVEFDNLKIDRKDIKTQSTTLTPKYEYCYNYPDRATWPEHCKVNPSGEKIVGYIASQYITISLDKKEVLEQLVGTLAGLRAKDISGPNWELSKDDEDNAKNEARKMAVAEAKKKAETITDALGQSLGKVVSYDENFGGGNYPIMYARAEMAVAKNQVADAAGGAPIPVSQGENKVSVNVNITYEIR